MKTILDEYVYDIQFFCEVYFKYFFAIHEDIKISYPYYVKDLVYSFHIETELKNYYYIILNSKNSTIDLFAGDYKYMHSVKIDDFKLCMRNIKLDYIINENKD